MTKTIRVKAACMVACVMACAACSDEPSAAAVSRQPASIIVLPATLNLNAGASAQLQAQADDGDARAIGGAPLSYSAEQATAVEVTPTGRVTSLGPAGDTAVSVSSGVRSVRIPVHIEAGPAAQLVAGAEPGPSTVTAGSTIDIRILAKDRFGNAVPGAALVWQTVGDSGTIKFADDTTAKDGSATGTWVAGNKVGEQRIAISSATLPAYTVKRRVVAGAPASVILSEKPPRSADAPIGPGARVTVTAAVVDSYGNEIAGIDVSWTTTGRCTLRAIESSNSSPLASRTLELGNTVGTCVITARVPNSSIQSLLTVRSKDRSRRP